MTSFRLRFSLLASVAALALAHQLTLAQHTARAAVPTKRTVLDNIARSVLLPAQLDLAARCTDLAAAANALTTAPSIASLKRAQLAWKDALMAWRRTQTFVHGPVADLDIVGRIQFWPARRQSVDRVLAAKRPIDDSYIQELGAGAVGLSALEVVLFDPRLDDATRVASFAGSGSERQRKYVQALTRDLVKRTQSLVDAWQGPGGYATKFGASGQQQLNLLVNDMLSAIEAGAQNRLRVVIDRHTEPQFPLDLVEGSLSGTSHEGLLALLLGARTAFSGGDGAGLDDYLAQLNAPTARRMNLQFQRTIAAVEAIGGPLESAIASKAQAVKQAADECRTLEVLLKVEVASTLGVTLTFKSTDGD